MSSGREWTRRRTGELLASQGELTSPECACARRSCGRAGPHATAGTDAKSRKFQLMLNATPVFFACAHGRALIESSGAVIARRSAFGLFVCNGYFTAFYGINYNDTDTGQTVTDRYKRRAPIDTIDRGTSVDPTEEEDPTVDGARAREPETLGRATRTPHAARHVRIRKTPTGAPRPRPTRPTAQPRIRGPARRAVFGSPPVRSLPLALRCVAADPV